MYHCVIGLVFRSLFRIFFKGGRTLLGLIPQALVPHLFLPLLSSGRKGEVKQICILILIVAT